MKHLLEVKSPQILQVACEHVLVPSWVKAVHVQCMNKNQVKQLETVSIQKAAPKIH